MSGSSAAQRGNVTPRRYPQPNVGLALCALSPAACFRLEFFPGPGRASEGAQDPQTNRRSLHYATLRSHGAPGQARRQFCLMMNPSFPRQI